ncbi:hypothetical protein KXW38_001952, partial [Aspergillus fumigatus]
TAGARIVAVRIGGDRLRQREVDLADMIAGDRLVLFIRKRAWIDRLFDRDHIGAALASAEPHQNGIALVERLVVQPENSRADAAGVARSGSRMRDDVAALDEQFAVECDADGAARALAAFDRRERPALDRLDFRDLARGHDDDLVARDQAAGLDAAGDDAAVVEF